MVASKLGLSTRLAALEFSIPSIVRVCSAHQRGDGPWWSFHYEGPAKAARRNESRFQAPRLIEEAERLKRQDIKDTYDVTLPFTSTSTREERGAGEEGAMPNSEVWLGRELCASLIRQEVNATPHRELLISAFGLTAGGKR
jgi:hypothetical protein